MVKLRKRSNQLRHKSLNETALRRKTFPEPITTKKTIKKTTKLPQDLIAST